MHEAEHRAFAQPDEVREFPHGRAEIVKIGNGEVGRYTFEPGWRWSNDVKPIAKTPSCEAPHFQFSSWMTEPRFSPDRARSHPCPVVMTSGWLGIHRSSPWTGLVPVATRPTPNPSDRRRSGLIRKRLAMARKMIDCRKVPNDIGCTLTIAGTEEETFDAAVAHAVAKHGHQDTPELREMIRSGLEDVSPAMA